MPPEKTVIETQPQTPEEAEKLRIETEKLKQEIENLKEEHNFNVAKHAIELEIGMASVRSATAQAELQSLVLAEQNRIERDALSLDRHHFTYSFNTEIDHDTARACIYRLSEWMRNADGPLTITIIFDSPGGNAIDGMHLWDYIQFVRSQGHTVKTVALGAAASMAGILLQAGDERSMGRESYVMIHELSAGAIGKLSSITDTAAFLTKMQSRIIDIFAERSADALIAAGNNTPRQKLLVARRRFFTEGFKRKDWWLDSTECLKEGIVDSLI